MKSGDMVYHKTYGKKVEIISHYSGDVYRVKIDGRIVMATQWVDLLP